ncbi:MAG: copper ABC transporter ATP-binding protein [Comamonadaceae bacterium]|nr:copper ABC transporter ATP-binding protein [Comamonadaceae bacterium]
MTSTSADALVIEGLSKHHGQGRSTLKALDGVNLRMARGQLHGLIGHNGAGKSTLFKLVLGLITPTAGRIAVDGIAVGGRQFRQARQSIGYLPENLVLYDNLSGLETLHFFARLKGAPARQCPELLERVGLGAAAQRAVREYSKGMRQRLGFAQALLGAPQLLLLDEPTTGLDPSAIRDFYAQLDSLRQQGVTIVISSHILAELQQRVDRLALLANGTLRAEGTVAELRERSCMPVTMVARADGPTLDRLATTLTETAALGIERQEPQTLLLRCPQEHKMAVLQRLVAANLVDLQVREPTLEDVYFELRETP